MKRSSSSAASCSSSPSSSSSSSEIQNPDKKRPRRNPKSHKQKPSSPTPSSASGGRRSSIYRGVTRHRWTGRFEAHLWDKSSWNSLQSKKGRQVYLGAYDNEEAAARTYDLAALKYWGRDSTLNFSIETYSKELEEMENVTKEEYLASLRRQSSGFSRGVSKYRGVARHHHNGRWEARIGRVLGNKYLYLGTYNTQEEAAAAYDLAAIEYRGTNAVTNFDINNYIDKIKKKTEQSQEEQTVITITEADPNSSSFESSEVEDHIIEPAPPENLQNQHQQNPEQQEQVDPEEPLFQSTQILPPSEESSPMAVMDNLFEQDLPWSFMEDYGFSSFEIPDFASGDLRNMFDGSSGFEDDIDFLIRPEPEESDFNLNAILNSPSYEDLMGAAATTIMVGEDDGPEKLPCSATSYPSSSPSSSISSNYTL